MALCLAEMLFEEDVKPPIESNQPVWLQPLWRASISVDVEVSDAVVRVLSCPDPPGIRRINSLNEVDTSVRPGETVVCLYLLHIDAVSGETLRLGSARLRRARVQTSSQATVTSAKLTADLGPAGSSPPRSVLLTILTPASAPVRSDPAGAADAPRYVVLHVVTRALVQGLDCPFIIPRTPRGDSRARREVTSPLFDSRGVGESVIARIITAGPPPNPPPPGSPTFRIVTTLPEVGSFVPDLMAGRAVCVWVVGHGAPTSETSRLQLGSTTFRTRDVVETSISRSFRSVAFYQVVSPAVITRTPSSAAASAPARPLTIADALADAQTPTVLVPGMGNVRMTHRAVIHAYWPPRSAPSSPGAAPGENAAERVCFIRVCASARGTCGTHCQRARAVKRKREESSPDDPSPA